MASSRLVFAAAEAVAAYPRRLAALVTSTLIETRTTIVRAPAMARFRRGMAPTKRPRRSGSSTQRQVAAASTIDASTSTVRSASGSGALAATAGSTSAGQCHR